METPSVLSKELQEELRKQGLPEDQLVIVPGAKPKSSKVKKSALEHAIETYKPRPDKAAKSMKKDQVMAEEVKEYLKEQKRVMTLKTKQEAEIERRSKREELFARLQKSSLDVSERDNLQGSSMLNKPLSNKERESGKVGERQRKRKRRTGKNSEARVISGHVDSSSDSSGDELSDVDRKLIVSGLPKVPAFVTQTDSAAQEDDEEEIGLLIAPTPPPPNPVFSTESAALVMSKPSKVDSDVPVRRSRTNSTVSNRSNGSKRPRSGSVSSKVTDGVSIAQLPFVVRPSRPDDLAESRSNLPVCRMEQEIMEAVKSSHVVFVCGETGSGKTTQVPQFLLEAGFGCTSSPSTPGMICVSQPRRVAAVSVADRVAKELGCPIVDKVKKLKQRGNRIGTEASDLVGCVGYQIRHDADSVSEDCTRLKFCTDGILLRECKEDFLLRKYSCIVMDEVHERGLNSDLLLGMLSRIVPLRDAMSRETGSNIRPLKLLLMSATLDVEDFARLGFSPSSCPVIKIETRQHPVTPHFSKRTEQVDFLNATFRKICRVHERLPPGGVLVFLPGQHEIEWMCRQLRDKYDLHLSNRAKRGGGVVHRQADDKREEKPRQEDTGPVRELVELGGGEIDIGEEDAEIEGNSESVTAISSDSLTPRVSNSKDSTTKSNLSSRAENDSGSAMDDLSDLNDTDDEGGEGVADEGATVRSRKPSMDAKMEVSIRAVHIVPLYSRLSAAKQRQAFEAPDDPEARVIIVATNIAETSLTIPGIRYVVDCGRERRRVYDARTGSSSFQVEWISQQSAQQRMGRAGRTGPGHCYRLYSSAVFADVFPPKSPPEMQLVPVDDLVLYMKSLGIERVAEFPFPTALDPSSVRAAVLRLCKLGLLEAEGTETRITKLGVAVSKVPVSFRVGKQLVIASADPKLAGIRHHLVALAALQNLPSPFDAVGDMATSPWRGDSTSDALALLRCAGAYSHDPTEVFCVRHRLNLKTMREFCQLYAQLTKFVLLDDEKSRRDAQLPKLRPLTKHEETLVKQTVVSGLLDRVARRMEPSKARAVFQARGEMFPPRYLRDWPYETSDDVFREIPYVFLHMRSFIVPCPTGQDGDDRDSSRLPEMLAFGSLDDKGRLEHCTALDSGWLRSLSEGTSQCVDQPSDTPEPVYDPKDDVVFVFVRPMFGDKKWILPLERVPVSSFPKGDNSDLSRFACRAFARALLEGKVVGKLIEEAESAAPFAQCTRPVLQARVANLVGRLMRSCVVTKRQAIEKWQNDPTFLKAEIIDWVRSDFKKRAEEEWGSKIKRILVASSKRQ